MAEKINDPVEREGMLRLAREYLRLADYVGAYQDCETAYHVKQQHRNTVGHLTSGN